MPVTTGQDNKGCFARWGQQHKYYYECGNDIARNNAKQKAEKQGVAIGEFDFESISDYPQSIRDNAKRGIRLNEENNNKCATQVGKVRAQQLAKGESISIETIKRMYSYLSRAETYYKSGDKNDCGYISYLLWGGPEALNWSKRKLEQLDSFDIELSLMKISFDYNETLTQPKIQDIARQYIKEGNDVYIISANRHKERMFGIASKLGIPHNNIYATGSNKSKIRKVLELGIDRHYDNNEDVINQLGKIGKLVQLSLQERFQAYVNFMRNDDTSIG